jgi:hypothetical protein
MPTPPPPLYPKTIARSLTLLARVNTLDEEKYFLSKDPTDNLQGDLAINFFPEVGITLISIDGIAVPKT